MSSAYSISGSKRQKVRESRADVDYFQGIDKIEFNNMSSVDTVCYRHYNANERLQGRTMEEWLKLSVSLTHFRRDVSDPLTRPFNQPWRDGTNTLDSHKRTLKACVDMCGKLGVKYITAYDSDLVPYCENWDESRAHWEEMYEYTQELLSKSYVKMLWLAPDLHSNPRYSSGALTSPDAHILIMAASQIKRCMEISQRLNCECFTIWPLREKYDAIFYSDIAREMKTFARILKMIQEYKERLNYRCQLILMPCFDWWMRKKCYMWDITSCLCFLKNNNLERFYKVCSPPGHQMYIANAYNMLGGININDSFDHFASKTFSLMARVLIQQGTIPSAGINLCLSQTRAVESREVLTKYVKFIDAAARGLRVACSMHSEQIVAKYVQQRYSTHYGGVGAKLLAGECTLEECEEHHKKSSNPCDAASSNKCEQLDLLFHRYIENVEQM